MLTAVASEVSADEPELARIPAAAAEQAPSELRRNLHASLGDGAAFGVMVGVGETYLPAFVLAVGLGEVLAGLVASAPMLAGGVMQLVSPWAVRRLGSHRRWVVLCAALQGLSFVPLIVAALIGSIPAPAVLLVATFYWGTGLAGGPAWNTWMGTLIPATLRAPFFARRTRLNQAAVLAGFLIGGAILQSGAAWNHLLPAFALLFGLAVMCRLLSVRYLCQHSEPMPIPAKMRYLTAGELVHRFRHGSSGRLLAFIVAMQLGVQISGPYFAPYMLRELKLSYLSYVALIGTSYISKVLWLPVFGQLAKRFGARRLLWMGGIGVAPVSSFWLISTNYGYLVAVQFLSGAVWAAYELAVFLLFFEAIPEEERTSILTVYNFANSAALVAGSLIGATVLYSWHAGPQAYQLLFAASALTRLTVLALLLWRVPRVEVAAATVPLRTIAVRPSTGATVVPVLPGLPAQSNRRAS